MATTTRARLCLMMILAVGSAHCAAETTSTDEDPQIVDVDVNAAQVETTEVKKTPPPPPPKEPYLTYQLVDLLVTSTY